MKTKKFTKAQLMSAYEELDDVAGIQPPIVWTTQELFERELYETIVQLIEPDDEFTKKTQSLFDDLIAKYQNLKEESTPEPETDVDDETEDDYETDVDDETELEDDTPEPEIDDTETKVKPKAEPKPKDDTVPESLTRADNFASIYKEQIPYTKDEWIKKMEDLYPKKVKNDVGARLHFNVYSKLMLTLGKMKITEDGKYVKA